MQFHIFQDARQEWRWQLSNVDGKCIADSGASYPDKESCLETIVQVRASESAIILESVTTLLDPELQQMPGLSRQH